MRANGMGMRRIAREAGLGIGTVLRLVNSAPRLCFGVE
jgi:transposase-like protein